MKRKAFLLIVCILSFAVSDCLAQYEPLANRNKRGLYARSIEQILRLKEDELDLATAVLIISEQWNDNVLGRRYVSRLDDMAYEIRSRLKARRLQANYKAIPVINEYLFEQLGFRSVKEARDPGDLFLDSVLDRKRGYCLSLSILYLALGERLGLPLYGVVVPGHFFVRYDDQMKMRFNIETTSKGANAPDEHYLNKFNVPDGDGIYMKNLNKMQTLGCFFNNLGNSYSDVGNVEGALRALEKAVEINPSLAESRTNLGNIYLKKGRVDDAIDEYQYALDINPDDAKTHNNLGNAYSNLGRLDDAISKYRLSLELEPNFIDAHKNLANAYCKKTMYVKAIAQLKQALALEPRDASVYVQLGNVYGQMDNCKKAISQYKKALKINSRSADAHYGIAVCYNKLGRVDDEIRAYKKALAFQPKMFSALANLGNAYFQKQNYDVAVEQYKKASRVKPDDGAVRYNLGAAYFNQGRYAQAATEYLKAVDVDPQAGNAHKGLAFAFYKLEKYDMARKHMKIAEQLGAEVPADLVAAIKDKSQ